MSLECIIVCICLTTKIDRISHDLSTAQCFLARLPSWVKWASSSAAAASASGAWLALDEARRGGDVALGLPGDEARRLVKGEEGTAKGDGAPASSRGCLELAG
jgi:hypothetical protein